MRPATEEHAWCDSLSLREYSQTRSLGWVAPKSEGCWDTEATWSLTLPCSVPLPLLCSRDDGGGEFRSQSRHPSPGTSRWEGWGSRGGRGGGRESGGPAPCPLHDLLHWGQTPQPSRKGKEAVWGHGGMALAGGWGQGYQSGGSEQGSSAYTTSRECSRASKLSTLRAARRGRPSARPGTCASSPRTRACTWHGEAGVSDWAALTPRSYSLYPLLAGAAQKGLLSQTACSNHPTSEGDQAGVSGGRMRGTDLVLQPLPTGFQG